MKTIISIDFDAWFQNRPPWDSLSKHYDISSIASFIERFQKPITVFAREDKQTIRDFGLGYFYSLVNSIHGSPIEIGWHPHVFDDANHIVKEEEVLLSELKKIFEQSEFAQKSKLVRVGACQGGNSVMGFLAENFDVDSSAMSQCVRQDSLRWYDWSKTQGSIYRPSVVDYMTSGEQSHDIWEIPITTLNVFAPYDDVPKRRIFNPSIKSSLLKKSILDSKNDLFSLDCLVIACHAEELEIGYENDLYTYGLDNVFDNLLFIEEVFECEYTSFQDVCKGVETK